MIHFDDILKVANGFRQKHWRFFKNTYESDELAKTHNRIFTGEIDVHRHNLQVNGRSYDR